MARFELKELQTHLKKEVDAKGLRPLAASLGVPVSVLRGAIAGRNLTAESIGTLCKGLDFEFYIGPSRIIDEHGVDAVRKEIVDKDQAIRTEAMEGALAATKEYWKEHPATDSTEFSLVKLQNIQAGAGAGRVNGNPEPPSALAFNKTWLAQVGITPGQASLIYVAGDSMEPTLKDGSIVLIDHKQNKPAGKHIYAIREGDALMVKRVEKLDDKTLLLTSDNPRYTTRVLTGFDLDDVAIVGRVVWSAFTVGP